MKNVLFIASNIGKIGSAPRNRANAFLSVFKEKGDWVFDGSKSFKDVLRVPMFNFMYIETPTNRMTFKDLIFLWILKRRGKCTIVYIRDVYIEFFSENYNTLRGKLTMIANRVTYFILTLLADRLVFPTIGMGQFYFKENRYFPSKIFADLPPAALKEKKLPGSPDFNKKLGLLYFGSISYNNSGFEKFIDFSIAFKDEFNFFVLSNDEKIKDYKSDEYKHLIFDFIPREKLGNYIDDNNIAFALHTRPGNLYDEITYPIKILDFISVCLPFISYSHKPLREMMGDDYPLFLDCFSISNIYATIIGFANIGDYRDLKNTLRDVGDNNTFYNRYNKLNKIAET